MKMHPNNIFALAERQLLTEYGENYPVNRLVDYAIKIRHFIDRNQKFVDCILNGGEMSVQALHYHGMNHV